MLALAEDEVRADGMPTRDPLAAPVIQFSKVCKAFSSRGSVTPVIECFDLAIGEGEFVAIVGPSGSGKSTLLNMVAGLDRPSSGEIRYSGKTIGSINTDVSYLTQHDSLLPWRTVADNIAVPLEIRRTPQGERRDRVRQIVEMVGLSGFENHYPRQLSGGMRKRTMLARTLIYDPATILMDEPFGPLDAQLKVVLQAELLRLWTASRKTIVFVTHDIVEAITLADRVVVFSARPSRVKLVESIEIKRPRDVHEVRFAKEFAEHYRRLWEAIEVDVMLRAKQ
jgi:NitT/TauT family transport system ATP-binding protein